MPDIQAIVLDLDGTLLDSGKSVSPRNYRAVKKCFEAGIQIIVAKARPPRAVAQLRKDLPFVDYMVYYNGALVTCQSKQTWRHISIPIVISLQMIDFLKRNDPQPIITYEVNDAWYSCAPVSDSACAQFGARSNDPKPQVVDDEFIRSISPTKILVVGYRTWRDVVQTFGDQVNVIATDRGALVQIMAKSASKEEAVQAVLHEIGIHADQVMVFGDDYNDWGLFQMCGFPIAMGNGIDELKKCAAYITESNDHDGVAAALEKFILSADRRPGWA